MGLKTCSRCKLEQAIEDFSPRADTPDGRHYTCKACYRKIASERHQPSLRTIRRKEDQLLGSQVCSVCKERQPFENFSWRAGRKTYQSYCKACDISQQRFKKYGLKEDEFISMLEKQGHSCAACKAPLGSGMHDRAIDHCHATGRVRGILCNHCNLALGHLKDSPARLKALLVYLESHS